MYTPTLSAREGVRLESPTKFSKKGGRGGGGLRTSAFREAGCLERGG